MEKGELFECICKYLTDRSYNFKRHQKLCSVLKEKSENFKLYECEICEYKSKRKFDLNKHVKLKHQNKYYRQQF